MISTIYFTVILLSIIITASAHSQFHFVYFRLRFIIFRIHHNTYRQALSTLKYVHIVFVSISV